MKLLRPSLFTMYPGSSILNRMEYEHIALFMMQILARTGDEFRSLSWAEYREERIKGWKDDIQYAFQEGEDAIFKDVAYLALGDKTCILNFCAAWKDAYIKKLEDTMMQIAGSPALSNTKIAEWSTNQFPGMLSAAGVNCKNYFEQGAKKMREEVNRLLNQR